MRRFAAFRCVCFLCVLALIFTYVSCSPPDDIMLDDVPDIDESLPAFSELAPIKTAKEWCSLQGDELKLIDLISPWIEKEEIEEFSPGGWPSTYFTGVIKKIGADYLVIIPIVEQDDGVPSYSEELLKYGKCCVVPLWGYEMNEYYSISADDFAVGERVRVRFDDGWVAVNTEYGKIPVLRKVFGIRNLDRAWVPPTT